MGCQHGTLQMCPGCRKITQCRVVDAMCITGDVADQNQRQVHPEHEDVHFFQRARRCRECTHLFLTAEVDRELLEELLRSRSYKPAATKSGGRGCVCSH